ncbi:FHA domain-containing protein [Cyanobacterium stanieri LEGE 03274]|uniref:FHA domain-containing protein n=1 Tax=Cyanobacterium stanieri LEGE 03274 TaxID=1828756 RepID=A0ABR9V050_9CHRO|nr:FHA domain-containing protein [Cyanobacterium stanieri]MBE9221262.1 FHA domain-containing protein [Cyanobacterium stanieri LEGE 03274]
MYSVTLAWQENREIHTRTITENDYTLRPQRIIIGRGEEKECDIILKHSDPTIIKTVSKTHLEIFYDQEKNKLFAQNLTKNRQPPKQPNPIIINGKKIIHDILEIHKKTVIKLGKITLVVRNIELPDRTGEYIVKCSGQKKHILPPEYEGLNCPYCGYVVFTGTTLKS